MTRTRYIRYDPGARLNFDDVDKNAAATGAIWDSLLRYVVAARALHRARAARFNQEIDMSRITDRYNSGDQLGRGEYPPASQAVAPREQRTIETFIARARALNDQANICSERLQNCIERLAIGPCPAEPSNTAAKSPHEPPELQQLDHEFDHLHNALQRLGDLVGQIERL